jgi:GNAT superfamily N-acetyltransferase
MREAWFPFLKFPLPIEQFWQLPTSADYKYEYIDGDAWLTPRPKYFRAIKQLQPVRPLTEVDAQGPVRIRRLRETDWSDLAEAFSASFHRTLPFAGMPDEERLQAARACLEKARIGGDGPWIEAASFVAVSGEDDAYTLGAILVTLAPRRDLGEWDSLRWGKEAPSPDAIEKRVGRPHLTWVFVAPMIAGHGVGSALLANAEAALVDMGYTDLATSFLAGNTRSILWHWRNGFELLPYAGSMRQMRTKADARRGETTAET